MNQVIIRKIALSAASISIGCCMAVMLLFVCLKGSVCCSAESPLSSQEGTVIEGIRISCTPLIVERLAFYDGVFYEDGTGREVMDVAALMLHNCSDVTVPFASVVVYTEKCRYEFEATMLPPDSSLLIPEMNGAALSEKEIVRCFGWITVNYTAPPEGVVVTEGQQISILNQSPQSIENLMVYHRTYLQENDIYLGGRAFATKIPPIAPGQQVTLLPDNYAPGYSRLVWYEIKQ